ncbi:heparinase II/III domain-containing protein [Hymenobacter sp. PAMC 26628]|uniref:heparinase II/III domain-containing protein n=1 Tax=Hymenobacter sp. PAMC 26628 TaxID=1484118 RepID=UPI00077022A4|nr:heparinase II/III family protein [Hymenobacter sp. PAMC 26628]AMJ67497.1 heparinase [Hymenobacter sp. PAMC 26628]
MNPPVLFRSLLLLLLLTGLAAGGQPAAVASTGPIAATTPVPAHPRLLLLAGQEQSIQQTIAADQTWRAVHQSILAECDRMVGLPVLQRIKVGRRLLDVSRECLRREFFLAYAWRMTRQEKYRRRAEQELLAVAAFSDWNPAHFLDVAEMTTGVALGYDWLYNDLSEATRATVREALLKKGLEPSLLPENNGWLTKTNNWNQVCNAGMAFGALALYDEQPVLARAVLNRAIETVVIPMRAYGPDGAYPEGYGYWGYGTSFNVLLISALEKAFGQDFGLSQQPGFLKTPGYLLNMTGPSGNAFMYSDSWPAGGPQPAMYWFAAKLKNPSLLWVERTRLEAADASQHVQNRLLPALMLWSHGIALRDIPAPAATQWVGGGPNPVALLRTSWTDPNALYLGLKAGSPAVSHGHMDVGSFVFEADGVRWSMDFGAQDYESLESKGIDPFGKQRWDVFRLTNFAHSTLTVNNGLQAAKGAAVLTGHSAAPDFQSATTDLSPLYPALAAAHRGVALVDGRAAVVRDELTGGSAAATVRWAMLTPATVKILNPTTAELTNHGKKLRLQVAEPATITLKTWPTVGPHDYDAPNPGTTLVGFEVTVPANAKVPLSVLLVPGSAGGGAPRKVLPLAQWPQQTSASAGQ